MCSAREPTESRSQEEFTLEKIYAKLLENFVARSLNFASPSEFSLNTYPCIDKKVVRLNTRT